MSTTAGVSIIKACLNNFNNEAWAWEACEACEYIIKIIFYEWTCEACEWVKEKKGERAKRANTI